MEEDTLLYDTTYAPQAIVPEGNDYAPEGLVPLFSTDSTPLVRNENNYSPQVEPVIGHTVSEKHAVGLTESDLIKHTGKEKKPMLYGHKLYLISLLGSNHTLSIINKVPLFSLAEKKKDDDVMSIASSNWSVVIIGEC